MRVADLGCGVGGPLREIARVSGATIVGVNNNDYQIERARKLTEEAGLGHLAEFLKSDFMQMDAPDESFDAAYAIEATVHAPSKVDCYGEVFRVLKPGGCFAAYDYCLTSRFDANNRRHQKITCLSMKVRSPMPCSCSCLSPTRSQRRRRELHGTDSDMAQRLETAMAHTLRLGSLAELHG